MTINDNRQRILDYHASYHAMDLDRVMTFYADHVDFVSFAPVDIIPHLGQRRTKQEMRETIATIYARYHNMRYELSSVIAEADRVATIIRVFLQKMHRDRIVQLDVASFFTLQNGLIVQEREFLDSYDLVQQMMEVDIGAVLAKAGS